MWTWNPRPWQHAIDYAVMLGGVYSINMIPANIRADYNGLVFLFVGGLITTGMVSYVCSEAVMTSNKVRDNRRDIRMLDQPTVEERNTEEARILRMAEQYTKVKTNFGDGTTVVYKTPEVTKKVPEGFVAMQNTAQVIRLAEVDNAIRKICRRNVTLIEHPELGFPDGDFREVTWVATKEMTRKSLLLAIAILERHQGIERKGSNGNSTWIVKDPEVIKRGAKSPLKHPPDCWCADCKEGNV
jgi:hypothetical protein